MAKEESQDGKFHDYFFTVWHEVPDGEKSILRKQGYQEVRAGSLEEAARASGPEFTGESKSNDKPICLDKITYLDGRVEIVETAYDGLGSGLGGGVLLTLRKNP